MRPPADRHRHEPPVVAEDFLLREALGEQRLLILEVEAKQREGFDEGAAPAASAAAGAEIAQSGR